MDTADAQSEERSEGSDPEERRASTKNKEQPKQKAKQVKKDPAVVEQTAAVFRRLAHIDPLAAAKAAGSWGSLAIATATTRPRT